MQITPEYRMLHYACMKPQIKEHWLRNEDYKYTLHFTSIAGRGSISRQLKWVRILQYARIKQETKYTILSE
jgi:hypothetical protein